MVTSLLSSVNDGGGAIEVIEVTLSYHPVVLVVVRPMMCFCCNRVVMMVLSQNYRYHSVADVFKELFSVDHGNDDEDETK
eukprot:Awhi_evm1s3719